MKKMNTSGEVTESIRKVCEVITLDELKKIIADKKESEISILVTGDVHIASRTVDNQKIIDSVNRITSNEILRHTDSLVINGDFLDRRISLASEEAADFILLGLGLLNRCREHGVSLDVLEGTPSHDNGQPFILTLFNRYSVDKELFPIRYIDRVSVVDLLPNKTEWMKKHYGRVLKSLFIPDEINPDAQTTWGMVRETLSLQSLESVDMSYLHGTFRYQEPLFTEKSHVEENYESITDGRIVINHWHLPSAKGSKIRAPGSLERLRHNEEETKGFYYCILSPGASQELLVREYFVINESATIFKTIDVSKMDLSKIYSILDDILVTHPDARIRLQLSRLDGLYPSISEIKSRYRSLKISEKITDVVTETVIDFDELSNDLSYSIRPDNIHELILDRLEDTPAEIRSNVSVILGGDSDESRGEVEGGTS